MARRRKAYTETTEDQIVENQTPVEPLDQKEEMVPETKNGIVCNAPLVRVRNDPSEIGDVVTVLDQGDEVKILDTVENRFYKIELDKDRVGYISCNFCKEVE